MKKFSNVVERLAAGQRVEKELTCQAQFNRNSDLDTVSGKITISDRKLIPGRRYRVVLVPVH